MGSSNSGITAPEHVQWLERVRHGALPHGPAKTRTGVAPIGSDRRPRSTTLSLNGGCSVSRRIVAKAFQEARKGQTCLSTGQRCTQAVVYPTAKGKMAGFTAGDVKLLWGMEHLWIVVGGTEQQHNALAFGDALSADLYILERRTKI